MSRRTVCKIEWATHTLYLAGVFALLCIFFLKIRPIVLSDADDWTYIMFSRGPWPILGHWNPARVLPEILMPICGHAAAGIADWFSCGFLQTASCLFGVVISACITVYIALFDKVLIQRMHLSIQQAIPVSALFLMAHFLIFMTGKANNTYLFYAWDACCYFFYVIPALLNAQLVLMCEAYGGFEKAWNELNRVQRVFLVVAIYFALFSNLFSSVILLVYAIIQFMEKAKGIRRAFECRAASVYAKELIIPLLIILLWIVTFAFEMSGGRAGSVNAGINELYDDFKDAILDVLGAIKRMNPVLLFICVWSYAATIIQAIKMQAVNDTKRIVLRHLLCAFLVMAYLLVLSAAVEPSYIVRGDVMIGAAFYVFGGTAYAASGWIRRFRGGSKLLGVLGVVFLICTISGAHTFKESNIRGKPSMECAAISQAFLDQIMEAERTGKTEMVLEVPFINAGENWPYPEYIGTRMAFTMRQLHIIENVRHIRVKRNRNFNQEYLIE